MEQEVDQSQSQNPEPARPKKLTKVPSGHHLPPSVVVKSTAPVLETRPADKSIGVLQEDSVSLVKKIHSGIFGSTGSQVNPGKAIFGLHVSIFEVAGSRTSPDEEDDELPAAGAAGEEDELPADGEEDEELPAVVVVDVALLVEGGGADLLLILFDTGDGVTAGVSTLVAGAGGCSTEGGCASSS